jgi:hypothetical protein
MPQQSGTKPKKKDRVTHGLTFETFKHAYFTKSPMEIVLEHLGQATVRFKGSGDTGYGDRWQIHGHISVPNRNIPFSGEIDASTNSCWMSYEDPA